MNTARFLVASSLVFSLSAVVGCTADTNESASEDSASSLPSGLTVIEKTATSVHGTYAVDASKIEFELRNENAARTILIRSTTTHESLLEAVSTVAHEDVRLFDGRLRMEGASDAKEPTFIGDRGASDELAARAEAPAIDALPMALEQTFPALFTLVPRAAALTPQGRPIGAPNPPPPPPAPAPSPRPDLWSFTVKSMASVSFVAWKSSQSVDWSGPWAGMTNCVSIKHGSSAESQYCQTGTAAWGHVVGSWYGQTVRLRNSGQSGYADDLLVSIY